MNTAELKQLVAKRFSAPEYGLLWEVGNATGFGCNRHCDGLAMSLWPSRGLHLIGLELKVSRTDWLKELKNPAKAESIAQYCDRWYLITGEVGIVREGELPNPWGLIVVDSKGKLKDVTPAPSLLPKPVPREFLAAIFRRATEQSVDENLIKKAAQESYRKATIEAAERHAKIAKKLQDELRQLQARVQAFEAESGISISPGWGKNGWQRYEADDIGRTVREVLNGSHRKEREELERIGEIAASIVKMVEAETKRGTNGAKTTP